MTCDDLDSAIEQAVTEYERSVDAAAKAARHVELLGVKLEALKLAASLRPLKPDGRTRHEGSGGKGRQPGAISKPWRNILHIIYTLHGATFIEEDRIAEIARSHGLPNTRAKDVRDRMASYEIHSYVETGPDGKGWRVTGYAANKFSQPQLAQEDDASDEPEDEVADAA